MTAFKRGVLVSVTTVSCLMINAQVFIEVGPVQNNRDAFSSVVVYGSNGLNKNLPYDQINGSAFWKNDWSTAYFYDKRDTFLGKYKARFNFVNNEVHYIDRNGAEKAVVPGELKKIIFFQADDSMKIAAIFRSLPEEIMINAACKICYVQELNQGNVKLMKLTRRLVKSRDSLFNTTKSYFFYDESEYFLQFNEKYEKIKKLKKENIFSFLPNTSSFTNWINEMKLNFNKETDCIIFLNHYNSTRSKNLP